VRGFAGAVGNVVINGARPSAKAETLQDILRRIPASQVVRVELMPGALVGAEYRSRSQVLNIVLAEGILVVAAGILAAATWPEVPWNLMLGIGLVLMAIAPFAFYPLSLCLWMVCDLAVRPLTAQELEWHRNSAEGQFRGQGDR